MRNMKKLLIAVLCLLVFSSTIVIAVNVSKSKSVESEEDGLLPKSMLDHITTVISNVKKYYYKTVGNKDLLKHALDGMLTNLDPHSAYLDAKDLKDLETDTTGKFGGIGIEIFPERGAIKVISPLDDTPAYKAGVKAGDYIIQIDDKFVRDLTLREAVNMMRGKSRTKLKLTVIRENTPNPLIFNLTREIIKIKSVKGRMLEPGYGYIRVAVFQDPSAKDLIKSIKKLQKETKGGLKGLVLDMRNNPGGLLGSGVQIADFFLDSNSLKKNDLIVYTKGQIDESKIVVKATPGDLLPNVAIVVLINGGSASASEIVAGALQDHKRAIIVGTKSFGKGSVQTLIHIDKDSAIKLTTALYYTPLGRLIQAKGIQPDINITNLELVKDDRNKVKDIIKFDESALVDHIKNGKKDLKDLKKKKDLAKKELDLAREDFQLYEALHILKSQNILEK